MNIWAKKAKEAIDALKKGAKVTSSGLAYKIIKKGTGAKAEAGKTVSVHYTGNWVMEQNLTHHTIETNQLSLNWVGEE